jgi:hypothetical protein
MCIYFVNIFSVFFQIMVQKALSAKSLSDAQVPIQ